MSKVTVIGSIGGDVVAVADHHPGAGETVHGSEVHYFPGGKGANQALAAALAGSPTRIAGRVGRDAAGQTQRQLFASAAIDDSAVITSQDAPTQTAIIVVDAHGENRIVVVGGASATVTPDDIGTLQYEPGEVVVAQFEIPQATVMAAFTAAHSAGAITVLNPAPAMAMTEGLAELVDILVVNESETSLLSGRQLAPDAPVDAVIAVAETLRCRVDQTVVVTLGARGVVALTDSGPITVAGHTVDVVDTTGAGDCFAGYLASGIARGQTIGTALEFANCAAAVCVQRLGAGSSMPARADVAAFSDGQKV